MPDNSSQRCYELKDGPGCNAAGIEQDWQLNSCAYSTLANLNTCESACGAPSVCDEKKPDMGDGTAFDTWTEGATIYKCDSGCDKVVVDDNPPEIEIIAPDDEPTNWYGAGNRDMTFRISDSESGLNVCFYQIQTKDLNSRWEDVPPGYWTAFPPEKCTGTLPIEYSVSNEFSAGPGQYDSCRNQGYRTCRICVEAFDKVGQTRIACSVYNIDFSPPSIEKQ
jgi:hypothetical protein